MTETIAVPISPELLEILDRHVQQTGALGRAEYLLALLREDLKEDIEAEIAKIQAADAADPPHAGKPLAEILEPLHKSVRLTGYTDAEVNSFLDDALRQVRAERRQRREAALEVESQG